MRRLLAGFRAVRLIHFRELLLHPLRTVIAVVSVAAGVAMVLSIVVVVRSTTTSFEQQATALAGPAPLRVTGVSSAGGLDQSTVDAVRAVDGVASAVPMIRAVTSVESDAAAGMEVGDDVLVLGIDCQAATFLGVACAALSDEPLLSSSLEPEVQSGAFVRTDLGRLPLSTAAVEPALDGLGDKVAVLSISAAQRFFSRAEGLDVVFVVPADGVTSGALGERLRSQLGPGGSVLAATDQPVEFEQVLNTIIPLFGILGLFALGIGMSLVANTVALSLEERRLQLAIVSALGGTGPTLLGGALLQAAVIGLLGGLVGIGGAILLAYPLTASVSGLTLPIAGVAVSALPSEAPISGALLLGAGVAVMAAWRPARRAQRSDVAAELSNRDRRTETGSGPLAVRALLAVAIGLAGIGITTAGGADGSLDGWQPAAATIGLLVAIVGFSLALARLTPFVAQVILRRLHPRSGAVRLALANLVREPARTGVMAVAIGSAVGVAFLVASFNDAATAGITDGVTSNLAGGVALSIGAPGQDPGTFARVPPEVVDQVAARPDVASVHRSSFVFVSDDVALGVVGTDRAPFGLEVYRGTADPRRFAEGEVMVVRPWPVASTSSRAAPSACRPGPAPFKCPSRASGPTATSSATPSRCPMSSSSGCTGHVRSTRCSSPPSRPSAATN